MGLSYSAINTACSSLSAIHLTLAEIIAGAHPLVIRFMKGVFNLRPTQSRYLQTWDVSLVLSYLRRLSPISQLSLKLLTLKLAMLIAFTLASRSQSLHLLSIKDMRKGFFSYTLCYSGSIKNQSQVEITW